MPQPTRTALAALALVHAACASFPERVTDEQAPLVWDPAYRSVDEGELVVTGAATAAAGIAALFRSRSAHWRGGVLFDDWVRAQARTDDPATHGGTVFTADLLAGVVSAYPLVVDSLIVAWWKEDSPEVAWNTAVITAQSMALAGAVAVGLQALTRREQPWVRQCRAGFEPPGTDCEDPPLADAFIGFQGTVAFAAAGALCAHHEATPLYGGGSPDRFVCLAALLGATLASGLELIPDRKYATDFLAEAAVGLGLGYLLPYLLYYDTPAAAAQPPTGMLVPLPMGDGGGVGWVQTF